MLQTADKKVGNKALMKIQMIFIYRKVRNQSGETDSQYFGLWVQRQSFAEKNSHRHSRIKETQLAKKDWFALGDKNTKKIQLTKNT